MIRQRPKTRFLLALAVAVGAASTGCGGGSQGNQSGTSSTGGGSVVAGAAVIGIGFWLAKSLMSKTASDDSLAQATLQGLSMRIGKSTEFSTRGNLGYVVLNSTIEAQARNSQFCGRFLQSFSGAQQSHDVKNQESNVPITVWTVLHPKGIFDQSDCKDLLQNFDYNYSQLLMKAARVEQSPGPFLISRLRSTTLPQLALTERSLLVWNLSTIEQKDFWLVLRAWAMMQNLSVEEMKIALSQGSNAEIVDKIAGIAASRAYKRNELLIAIVE